MLSGELIPPGHSSPHLLSVQKLAHEFVNAYTTLQAKIAALNTVTTEQLHETSRLKQELSLVCSNQHRNNSQVGVFAIKLLLEQHLFFLIVICMLQPFKLSSAI